MNLRFPCLALVLGASLLLLSPPGRAQQMASTNAASANPAPAMNPSQQKIADAMQRINANDLDGAIASLTEALKLNPNIASAYVLRASLYYQKKLWPQAEADFQSAARIAPTNNVLKFNLLAIKLMQKKYDEARTGFVALEKDPDMGDFASFQVFLCDLLSGREPAAKKELDHFDDVAGNPSYYFSNAAWSIAHKKYDDANGWLHSAAGIYSRTKFATYAQSLVDLGYLPIPQSAQK